MQKKIENEIRSHFKTIYKFEIVVEPSECSGDSINILLVSDDFKELQLVKRHQKIQQILKEMKVDYHKLNLKLKTKDK